MSIIKFLAVLFTGAVFFLLPINSLAISSVTVDDIQQKRAKFVWQPEANAARYEVSFGTDPQASNRTPFFVEQPEAMLKDLLPNTIYHVKVRAITGGRAGKWSNIQTFSTVIPSVRRITIDEIGTTYIKFSWDKRYQDMPDVYYDIAVAADEKSVPFRAEHTNDNHFTVTSLTPATKYYVKFRLRNPLKNGPWSSYRIINTLAGLEDTPPTDVVIKSINSKEVAVSWDKLSNALRYECAYSADGYSNTVIATSNTRLTVELPSNETFSFKLRGLTIGDQTNWTEPMTHLTLPSTPVDINIAAQTINETILHWPTPPGKGSTLTYHVRWGTDGSGTNIGLTPTAQASITLDDLKSNRHYAMCVRSVNETGVSNWSRPVSFSTLPEKLSRISIDHITHDSADIRWPGVHRAINYELSYGSDLSASHHIKSDLKKTHTTITDLIPDLTYYVKVRPVLPNLVFGAWSTIVSFKTVVIPGAPDKPQLVKVDAHESKLAWPAVPSATGYELMLSKDPAVIEGKTIHADKETIVLSSLDSNQHYYIKCRALNTGGAGEWSDITSIITAPADAPDDIKITEIAPKEAIINWKPHSGNSRIDYILRYSSGEDDWQNIPTNSVTSYQLTGLLPNTEYTVQVKAQNISGDTKWSTAVEFKTPPASPSQSPTGLEANELTDISALCSWHRMPKTNTYIIRYGTDMDASNLGEVKTHRIRYHFKNLIPETAYYFKIKSVNQSGESPWSPALYLKTKATPPITAPSTVEIIDTLDTSITLSWKTSYSILHYEVSIGTDPEASNMGKPKIANDPPHTFESLTPDTTYFLKVRQVNKGGSGPWSRILKQTTLPE